LIIIWYYEWMKITRIKNHKMRLRKSPNSTMKQENLSSLTDLFTRCWSSLQRQEASFRIAWFARFAKPWALSATRKGSIICLEQWLNSLSMILFRALKCCLRQERPKYWALHKWRKLYNLKGSFWALLALFQKWEFHKLSRSYITNRNDFLLQLFENHWFFNAM